MEPKGGKLHGYANRNLSQPQKHIENRRLFNLAFGRLKLEQGELSHLHRCEVCQGVLYVLVHQPISIVPEKPEKPDAV